MERNRAAIVALAAVAGIVLIAAFVFVSASAPVYACSSEWQPSPTASPSPGASPNPGYPEPDMGQRHANLGQQVTYTYCPPASGQHYNEQGAGPIQPRLYGPNDRAIPQGWIHNLEHGGLVILYRGDSPEATEQDQAGLRALYDSLPNSPRCGIPPGQSPGVLISRFDEMATPFAALVWGRVLPLSELDENQILEFWRIWGERSNPEQLCQPPSAAPSPEPVAPSAAPSGSPATSEPPSEAPSESASSAPSAS